MPTSRATRVTSEMNPLSWSTIALIVFFSSSISPRTSAETFLLRSPSATAPMTRCISMVGRTRSSIRLLTDSTLPGPALGPAAEHDALRELALLADHLADPGQLGAERLVGDDDVVEAVGDLAGHARPLERHPGGEVAALDLGEDAQQDLGVDEVVGCRPRESGIGASKLEDRMASGRPTFVPACPHRPVRRET